MSGWPPSLVNQSVHPAKCRANSFWERKSREGSSKGIAWGGGGGGMHSLLPHGYFIFGSDVNTLYIKRNGFRPAWGGFEVERLFHAQNEVSQRFGFG